MLSSMPLRRAGNAAAPTVIGIDVVVGALAAASLERIGAREHALVAADPVRRAGWRWCLAVRQTIPASLERIVRL